MYKKIAMPNVQRNTLAMPAYEYECAQCGHRLLGTGAAVVFNKALAPAAPTCPCKEELKEVCCA